MLLLSGDELLPGNVLLIRSVGENGLPDNGY
jgi:hypothetical protein